MSSPPKLLAKRKRIGTGAQISAGVVVQNARGEALEEFVLGDFAFLGEGVRIIAPSAYIGDYTIIHQRTTIYGYSPIFLGHSCWVGQDVIINCTAPIWIGRGVTIGAKTSIWTHLSGGDVLQGFRLTKAEPATIFDDAWIGPNCTVSPVIIGEKACVLAGSVVTHNLPENRIYAGVPAKEITVKAGSQPFISLSIEERFAILAERLVAFDKDFKEKRGAFSAYPTTTNWTDIIFGTNIMRPSLQFFSGTRENFELGSILITMSKCFEREGSSVFSVLDRRYTKKLSVEEVAFMRFLLPTIKFFPMHDAFSQEMMKKFSALVGESEPENSDVG